MSAETLDDRGVVIDCPSCGQKNRLGYDRLADEVRCGKCKTALPAPQAPIEVRDVAAFDHLISKSSLPIVVDFWAPWCGPCRMVAPELQKVASRAAGRAIVIKVNTDELPELGERFRVMSIPMLAVFADGREVTRAVGARPAAEIEALIGQATPTPRR